MPPQARSSADYHQAIRCLDSIVKSPIPQKIRIIEEIKFEFDFLSTILLVWKTEISRQKEEEARKKEEEEVRRKEAEVRRKEASAILEAPIEIMEDDPDDPPPPRLALPAPAAPPSRPPAPQRALALVRGPVPARAPTIHAPSQPALPRPQLALPPPPRIASPMDPMPVDPAAASEQTVRTKCGLCPDKSSETVEELLQHYSFMHFREQIEKAYISQWDECPVCQEKFSLKFNLIKHLGFVHGAVNMDVTATERWICTECQKEFLSDEFLRKHLIKAHLEKEFENRYYVLNESEEMLCQFCDKTFSYKKNLFCHVGLEHGKLEELRPDYNRAGAEEQLLKCRHCDFGGELGDLKTHLAATHYRQSLLALCLEEQVKAFIQFLVCIPIVTRILDPILTC